MRPHARHTVPEGPLPVLVTRRYPRAQDEISSRLHYTAEYFEATAYLGALALSIFSFATIFGFLPFREMAAAHPVRFAYGLLITAGTVAGWWWTGQLLHARRRAGGWMALVTLVPPLVERLLGRGDGSVLTLMVAGLGCLAILTSWRELD